MVARKVGAALAAGCSVVLRPAPSTPLIASELRAILLEAGLPESVLEVVTSSDSAAAGRLLAQHEQVRKITFTGSSAVGASLCELAASSMKRVSMELGGHAPFVVFPDADLDTVAESIVASRYRNGGQSCIATNRLFLHHDISVGVLDDLSDRVLRLEVGNGLSPDTQIGPLIDEAAAHRLEELEADALARGAKTMVGGGRAHPAGLPGAFYQPTILTQVPPDARMLREETFGPVLSVTEFRHEEEAIQYANSTQYGLAAYVFTSDLGTAWRMTDGLDFGVVGVNDPAPSAACLPFGGMKMSGVGRECGSEGLLAFTEIKAVSMGSGARR
jgi:succinate-semialdehyde dehydrogenase/glutarate-semialdehyde dehydrogenase